MRALRRLLVLGVVGVFVAVTSGCSSDDDAQEDEEPAVKPGVYVGAVAFSGDRIALDLARPDAGNRQKVAAFVTDGTPDGDAEWFEGTTTDGRIDLTSVSGRAHLTGTTTDDQTAGTVTLADGTGRAFHAVAATQGAGIYEVTVAPGGEFTGISESGAQLQGRQNGIFVEGTITTLHGEKVIFRDADLSRAYNFPVPGGQPGRYTVMVSRCGLTHLGRGGDVKQGAPDANVIALDLGASTVNTPGVWYGKVGGGTDQFVMTVGEPDPAGTRSVRALVSDGEPEPEGDVEWFAGDLAGDGFNLVSASKNATMTGQVSGEFAYGLVALPGGPPRPFFAVPSGDGAGIYDVTVTADGRYEGTSEHGGRLALDQRGDTVDGTITTPDGRRIPLAAHDLTRVLDYPVKGGLPDTYVAFASPNGRQLIGRSGDVRAGTPGANIIGLDQPC